MTNLRALHQHCKDRTKSCLNGAFWRQTYFSPAVLVSSIVHTAYCISRRENKFGTQMQNSKLLFRSKARCASPREIKSETQAQSSWLQMHRWRLCQNESGSFLISALVIILFLTAIGVTIGQLTGAQYQHTKRQTFVENAELTAEAGIEQSVHQLNSDDSFTGYASPQTFFNNSTQGKGEFTTTISDNSDGKSKTVLSVGQVYRSASDSSPYITRKVKVTVVGTASNGYSVSTGPGGLILGGSATITNSNVYVNGTITMTGAAHIGTNNNPLNVDVANTACPKGSAPGSTYPTVCTDGSQPISLAYSTNIYGTVCATGQTSTGPNNNIQGGDGGSGLKPGCVAPAVSQPVYDRQAQINNVAVTGSGNSSPYSCKGSDHVTWPDNLELTGNVSISNSCHLTISGNVYVTGNLTIDGAAQIVVANSVGTVRPIIMVDGTISVTGSSSMSANTSGTGIDFVSFKNTTGNPGATPTGTNLYNSQQQQNITVGGAVNLPGMVFDAYWSKISLSGSGNVGAAAGQTVDLSGAGTVVFGTVLSSGSKTWSITSYQEVY
jgi:hypothetical protein